jgi:putative membrane protein
MTKSISRREAGALALLTAFIGGTASAHEEVRRPGPHHAGLTVGDQRYAVDTLSAGSAALLTSRMALSRASLPMVRQFAEFEVREQTGVAQILTEISGMRSPPPPDPRMAAVAEQLRRTAGSVFDRLYVQGQIEGHTQLLRIQETYLRGGRNPHIRHIATLSRGQILDHLAVLRHLDQMHG